MNEISMLTFCFIIEVSTIWHVHIVLQHDSHLRMVLLTRCERHFSSHKWILNHAIVPRKEWRGDLSLWTSRVRSIFWRDKRGMKKLTQRVSYKTNEWVQCGLNSLIPPGLLHRILWQSVDYFLNTFSYIQLDYSSFTIWIRFQLFPDGYDLSHSESTLKTITAIDLSI